MTFVLLSSSEGITVHLLPKAETNLILPDQILDTGNAHGNPK